MSVPAVSVVMPAYNHERFIADTVGSVLEQTFCDFELVIVDDGSTDRTGDIIREIDDSRIHYHYQENQDAYNALNTGLALARGRYISILNSDDLYLPNRLERMIAECHHQDASFLFSDVEPIDDDGVSLRDTPHPWNDWHQRNRTFYFEKNDLYRGFLHGNFMVSTSNLFMTRALCEKVGGFAPIRYLHDYDYIFRLLLEAESSSAYLQDETLLKYRIHTGNTLSEAAITGREQDREIIKKYMLARLPENLRMYAKTGAERLIELEHELLQAKRELENAKPSRPSPSPIGKRVMSRLKRMFRSGL